MNKCSTCSHDSGTHCEKGRWIHIHDDKPEDCPNYDSRARRERKEGK